MSGRVAMTPSPLTLRIRADRAHRRAALHASPSLRLAPRGVSVRRDPLVQRAADAPAIVGQPRPRRVRRHAEPWGLGRGIRIDQGRRGGGSPGPGGAYSRGGGGSGSVSSPLPPPARGGTDPGRSPPVASPPCHGPPTAAPS